MLDAKIPSGPIEKAWEKCRFDMKLVNPANRRKHTVLVVGSGLAGAAARDHRRGHLAARGLRSRDAAVGSAVRFRNVAH